MKREWLINGTLLIASVLAFFLIIEFGLRVTGLQTVKPNPPKIYQMSENPEISYELIPNLNGRRAYRSRIYTDASGFRIPSKKPPVHYARTPTFVVLGDSITFGYGVQGDETLPARLEEHMPEFAFINTGVPGYNLTQETALYKERINDLDPEALAIVFHFNDLIHMEPGLLDENGVLRPHGWTPTDVQCDPIDHGILSYLPARCWLDLNSAFYKAFKKLVNVRYRNAELEREREEARIEDAVESIDPENLEKYISQISKFVWALPEELQRTFVIWPDREMHKEARERLIGAMEKLEFTVIDLYDLFGNEAKTLGWDTVHPHPETIEQAAVFIEHKIAEKKMEGIEN